MASETVEFEPSFFNRAEWRFLCAACDRLIPEDPLGPGALAAGVPEFIDRHMHTPFARGELSYRLGPFRPAHPALGYQGPLAPCDVLRLGLQNAEAECIRRHDSAFHVLDPQKKDAFLSDLELGRASIGEPDAALFFRVLLSETRLGFFSDPRHGGNRGLAGWKLIRYPGQPGDYRHGITLRDRPFERNILTLEDTRLHQ